MIDEEEIEIEPGDGPPQDKDIKSRKGQKRQETKAELDARNSAMFWNAVLSDPLGRYEIWKIIQNCQTFQRPFQVGPNGFPQPEATWFQLGRKDIGESLSTQLMILARDGWLAMMDEHDQRFKTKRSD